MPDNWKRAPGEEPRAALPPANPAARDKVLVRCDCTCLDACPQGRRGMEAACQVWISAGRLKSAS